MELLAKDSRGRTAAEVGRQEGFEDVAALLEDAASANAARAARAAEEQDALLHQAFKEMRTPSATGGGFVGARGGAGRGGVTPMGMPIDEGDDGDEDLADVGDDD